MSMEVFPPRRNASIDKNIITAPIMVKIQAKILYKFFIDLVLKFKDLKLKNIYYHLNQH